MIEKKIDPSNLGLWPLAMHFFQFILAIFQEKQLVASETGKFGKETEVVKKTKIFFQIIFSI